MEQTPIRIRPFRLRDTQALTKWGRHEDPRYFHYNFPYTHPSDLQGWYACKKRFLSKWIYVIDMRGRVVGYITLKNIRWSERCGEMGIALDPSHMGKGIGKKAICLYLLRVFRTFFFIEEIRLKTSAFNTRAIACYEGIGFEHVKQVKEPFEEQCYRTEILAAYPDFEHDRKKLYAHYLHMTITKEAFFKKYMET